MTIEILPQSDCPGCRALREQNQRLAESSLVLIDRNVALASRVRAFEERDRMGAEMLLGLVFPAGGAG